MSRKAAAGAVNDTDHESLFRMITDCSLTGIVIVTRTRIRFVNPTFEAITGYSEAETRTMSPWDMVHPEERDRVRRLSLQRFRRQPVHDYYETRWIHKNGRQLWVEVRAAAVAYRNEAAILANVIDISDRKNAEARARRRKQQLGIQSRQLEETNTALRVLLEKQHEARDRIRDDMVFNVRQLVMPYIDALAAASLTDRQQAYVGIIRANLEEITAPYANTLAHRFASLTPRQIQIVNLIRRGQSSKQMAEILGVSKAAIDFHRHAIRSKLGLTGRRVNLKTYLAMIDRGPVSLTPS